MRGSRFDLLAKTFVALQTRRQVVLGLTTAILAGKFWTGPWSGHVAAQPGPTPTPSTGTRPNFPPLYVSPNPIALGDGTLLLDGKIFTIDSNVVALMEGTPAVPVIIDNEHYILNPATALLPQLPAATPAAATPPPENPCPGGGMAENVEMYLGDLGVTVDFVRGNEAPVGNLRWNGDLLTRYAKAGNVVSRRWCSGTLISEDLFLTAGHCFHQCPEECPPPPPGWIPWQVPRINGTNDPISHADIATNMHVDFHYQLSPAGEDQPFDSFPVVELVEYQLGNSDYPIVDYAIVRLGGNPGLPGLQYGATRLAPADALKGTEICVIGHGDGQPKQVEAGHVAQYIKERMYYDDLSTSGGTSGACILTSPQGPLVGIHTNGGCDDPAFGNNNGIRIEALLKVSPILSKLLAT